jgi:predicted DCC family thiol-disulfide oxidoreductase YuxK
MKPTLIYDGDCGFCSRMVEKVRKYDTENRIVYSPFQSIPDGAYTAADRARFKQAVHFLDEDRILSWGGHTLPHIMKYLPRWRKWAWFFNLSGILWFASLFYDRVARKRHLYGTACKV